MKKTLALFLFITFSSLVSLEAYEIDIDTNNQHSNAPWKTFTNFDYTIEYPQNWELSQSGAMGSSFILFSPLESANDAFRENINLIIQNLTGKNVNLEKFTEISEKQVKTFVNNPTLIESIRIEGKPYEYQKVVYTGDQGIYHLKHEQYYFVVGNNAYVLTFTCSQDTYDNYKEIGNRIMSTFKIKR